MSPVISSKYPLFSVLINNQNGIEQWFQDGIDDIYLIFPSFQLFYFGLDIVLFQCFKHPEVVRSALRMAFLVSTLKRLRIWGAVLRLARDSTGDLGVTRVIAIAAIPLTYWGWSSMNSESAGWRFGFRPLRWSKTEWRQRIGWNLLRGWLLWLTNPPTSRCSCSRCIASIGRLRRPGKRLCEASEGGVSTFQPLWCEYDALPWSKHVDYRRKFGKVGRPAAPGNSCRDVGPGADARWGAGPLRYLNFMKMWTRIR